VELEVPNPKRKEKRMHVNVAKEVATLEAMNVAELRARYSQVFGEETRVGHKIWLVRRIAWRLQALAEGDLSERARTLAAASSALSFCLSLGSGFLGFLGLGVIPTLRCCHDSLFSEAFCCRLLKFFSVCLFDNIKFLFYHFLKFGKIRLSRPIRYSPYFAETRLIWRLNEATLGTSLHKAVLHKGCAFLGRMIF
jgi:hypothetical protein